MDEAAPVAAADPAAGEPVATQTLIRQPEVTRIIEVTTEIWRSVIKTGAVRMKNRPLIDALLKRTDVSQVYAGGPRENTFVAGVTLIPGYRISRSMAQSLWETVKATDSELYGVILNITDGYRHRTYENISKVRGEGHNWTEYNEAW